jgi:amino acid adenylation domain-containing protein/non-ribosomal peptide synthase protein (TIGR01720 family)
MKAKFDKSNVTQVAELNGAQKGMLFHFLKDENPGIYNVQLVFNFNGELDVEIFKSAIAETVKSNDALRSVFAWEEISRPLQIILREAPLTFTEFHWQSKPTSVVDSLIEEALAKDRTLRFDLDQKPPIRFCVFKVTNGRAVITITHHHLLYDGWSTGILLKELFANYQHLMAGDKVQRISKLAFKDIHSAMSTQTSQRPVEEFWHSYLSGYESDTITKKIHNATPGYLSRPQLKRVVEIDGLIEFARQSRVTLASILQTAVAILLQKHLNTDDVVFGTVMSTRNGMPGIEAVMGNFINTLPFRLRDVPGRSFQQLVQHVHRDTIERQEYSKFSYAEIKQAMHLDPSQDLFDCVLAVENYPIDESFFEGQQFKLTFDSSYECTNIPLLINVFLKEAIEIQFNFLPGALEKSFASMLMDHLVTILQAIVCVPSTTLDSFEMLMPHERRQIQYEFNDTAIDFLQNETILTLFENQVLQTPANVALRIGDTCISYSEFNKRCNQFARMLQEVYEVTAGDLVGVMLEREENLMVAIFGVLKAGAAYVPIDPFYPTARIQTILEDARLKCLVSKQQYLQAIAVQPYAVVDCDAASWTKYREDNLNLTADPRSLMYVIYTSGSTGKPKGVMIEHHSVVNRLNWMQRKYKLGRVDVLIQKTPIVFDVSVWELFWWSFTGASLSILPPAKEKDPEALATAIMEHNVSIIHFVPSMLDAFLSGIREKGITTPDLSTLRIVFASGEALKPDHVNEFTKLLKDNGNVRLINLYGPTEATVDVTEFECPLDQKCKLVPIGKPIDNTRLYIIDRWNHATPIGVKGELCLAGVGLARGYFNNQVLSAQKFIAHPEIPGERIYRTGDVARWLPDGNVEYLDRLDNQVKIRGFRIEIGEVESIIQRFQGINQSVVLLREHRAEKMLVAYYTCHESLEETALKTFVQQWLPAYMIPAFFVRMDNFPLTPNGKLDRKALPAFVTTIKAEQKVLPETEIEKRLSAIWCEVLGIEGRLVDVTKSFFELGGHSLNVISLAGRISREFGLKVSIPDVFTNSQIKTLAAFIQKHPNSGSTVRIAKAVDRLEYGLSPAQRRIFFLSNLDKDSLAYNGTMIIRLPQSIAFDSVRDAMTVLMNRHESFRTFIFEKDGTPKQSIRPVATFTLERVLLTESPDVFARNFARPFRLDGSLVRAALLETADDSKFLLVDVHHIISDGQSKRILLQEFVELLRKGDLPPVPYQYRDYIEWLDHQKQQGAFSAAKQYWRSVPFKEFDPIDIPLDFNRNATRDSRSGNVHFVITGQLCEGIRNVTQRERVPLFSMMFTVFAVWLHKVCQSQKFVVGLPVSGRIHAEFEKIVGMFANTLPVPVLVSGEETFQTVLQRTNHELARGIEHQLYPYDEIINDHGIPRDLSRNPLFDVMMVFQHGVDQVAAGDLSIEACDVELSETKFDLTLFVTEKSGHIECRFEYSTALFTEETIQRFASQFTTLISASSNTDQRIADLPIVSAAERDLLLNWSDNISEPMEKGHTIIGEFERQARLNPDAVAVRFGTRTITYRQLNKMSNDISGNLVLHYGVKPGHLVGLMMRPSELLIPAILGVLKSGAAYVPIDADYPSERIATIINAAGANILLADATNINPVPPTSKMVLVDEDLLKESEWSGTLNVQGQDAAYVIFTSGSTGAPKGVIIQHASLWNYIRWAADRYFDEEANTFALFTSISFDLTVTSIFTPLVTGNTIAVFDGDGIDEVMEKVFSDASVNVVKMTPSHVKALIESGLGLRRRPRRLKLILGGENLLASLANSISQYFHENVSIYNEYGPTEATVGCMIHEYKKDDSHFSVPIGKPIDNTAIYILDQFMNVAPIGVPGELYIGGAGVALGYLGNNKLTRTVFVKNPFRNGERMYKSGDLARWLPDGIIAYHGRNDDQIKIRGYRIELAEIEHHLGRHKEIIECVVTVQTSGDTKELVAYYVGGHELPESALREHLTNYLPEYMVPFHYCRISAIPLSDNGKLDRRRLPAITTTRETSYNPPETEQEVLVARIWCDVLGTTTIGTSDNFFALGGDSIKCIQVSSRLRSAGYELPVKDIFRNPTIKQLCGCLRRNTRLADQHAASGKAEVSPIQQWFFHEIQNHRNHYNQSVMLHFPKEFSRSSLNLIWEKLVDHHDALRSRFVHSGSAFFQEVGNIAWSSPFIIEEQFAFGQDLSEQIYQSSHHVQESLDFSSGRLAGFGLFHTPQGTYLLIAIHHLVIDGVSWRIILEDIDTLLGQMLNGEPLTLPLKTDSIFSWSSGLNAYRQSSSFQQSRDYWQAVDDQPVELIPTSNTGLTGRAQCQIHLDTETTQSLLKESQIAFGTQVNDLLLAAFSLAIHACYGTKTISIDMESHGRSLLADVDVNRTVGWFTSIYPVVLKTATSTYAASIKNIKEHLRAIPQGGQDYLLWRFDNGHDKAKQSRQICFNYLGQFDTDLQRRNYSLSDIGRAADRPTDQSRPYEWELTSHVKGGRFMMALDYDASRHAAVAVQQFMSTLERELTSLVDFCKKNQHAPTLTPHDLTYHGLTIDQLDYLQSHYAIEDIYELSPMQTVLHFHHQMEQSVNNFFVQTSCRVEGRLNLDVLKESLDVVIKRYDVLRTLFLDKFADIPLQIVLKDRKAEFSYVDLRGAYSIEDLINNYRRNDRSRRFDLSNDPLVRLVVLQVSENSYEFIFSHPHIVMDGWSLTYILRDLRSVYHARMERIEIPLPVSPKYGTYVAWAISRLNEGSPVPFWRTYLQGYQTAVSVPKANRITRARQVELSSISFDFDANELATFSKNNQVTINTVLQCAWGVLLAKYNNTNDVVFGSVTSGRPAHVPDVESMVGVFINTIPVRIHYAQDETVLKLIMRIQENAIALRDHEFDPIDQILQASNLHKNLFDHIMILENYPLADSLKKDLTQANSFSISAVETFDQGNYGLAIIIVPGQRTTVKIDFDPGMYDQSLIERLCRQYVQTIQTIIQNPQTQISILKIVTEDDLQFLELHVNCNVSPLPRHSLLVDRFASQVKRTPDSVACVHHNERLSYEQLDRRIKQVSNLIHRNGAQQKDRISIFMPNGIEFLSTVMAAFQLGCAYVPIDVSYPEARVREIILDSNPVAVVTNRFFATEVQRIIADIANPPQLIIVEDAILEEPVCIDVYYDPDDVAYVIYTSGSTGKPKGVIIHQLGMMNHILAKVSDLQLSESDVVAQTASCCFDISVWQYLAALVVGATTHIIDRDQVLESEALSKEIYGGKITILESVPSLMSAFLDEMQTIRKEQLASLRWMIPTGERLSIDLVRVWQKYFPGIQLMNAYGPTEASDDVTHYVVGALAEDQLHVPIGKPVQNIQILIFDNDQNLCPRGALGEICVSGIGVGKGYWKDETKTARAFIPNPFYTTAGKYSEKLYRTGDVGYYSENGDIICLGRLDDQVKVRGNRIELKEIEARIREIDGIRDVAVIPKLMSGDIRLISYYTAESIFLGSIRDQIAKSLPEYMIPSFFVRLERFPVTLNGKLDKTALPDPVIHDQHQRKPPSTTLHERLLSVWADVLKRDKTQIGIDDDFFTLGGHSLLVASLANKIIREFKIDISLKSFFEHTTIEELAEYLITLRPLEFAEFSNHNAIEIVL